MEERRKFARFKAPFCLEYKDADASLELAGAIKDICVQGARVLLDTSLDVFPDALVTLSIFLPKKTLRIRGKVVWVKDRGEEKEVGVYFVDESFGQKKKISQLYS